MNARTEIDELRRTISNRVGDHRSIGLGLVTIAYAIVYAADKYAEKQ